jgi:hypothetical protein
MGEARRKYFAQNGVSRETITDNDAPDRITVHVQQDVEPVLDSIARDREIMPNNGANKLLGRLPLIIVEDLIKREIYDDGPKFTKWWNSSEADPWRIWHGRV